MIGVVLRHQKNFFKTSEKYRFAVSRALIILNTQ
jgi:hypothetical protein